MKAKRNRCCMAHRSHIATVASFGLVFVAGQRDLRPRIDRF